MTKITRYTLFTISYLSVVFMSPVFSNEMNFIKSAKSKTVINQSLTQKDKKLLHSAAQKFESINKSSSPAASNLTIVGFETYIHFKFNCDSGEQYKVKYKKSSSNNWITANGWSGGICPSGGGALAQIEELDCNTSYDAKVRRRWRTTWYETTGSTTACPITVPSNAVRIKHKNTGKCAYGYNEKVRNWGCWNDPSMAFTVINSSNNIIKLKHVASGLCLKTTPNNGGKVGLSLCQLPNTKFTKEHINSNEFRLKNTSHNQCLYGTNVNGGFVHHWQCWNDPNMVFSFE